MAEAPRTFVGKVDAYARDIEEADQFLRDEVGRDNPHRRGVVTDDGGRAEKELRDRTLRSMGLNPERYQ